MGLDKNAILSAVDLQSETVEVPEWGGRVRVRQLSAADMETFQASIRGEDGALVGQVRERFLAYTLVDDTGARLFGDADFTQLGAKSIPALNRVFAVAQRINGVGAAAKADIEKN